MGTIDFIRDLIAASPGFDPARLDPDRIVANLTDEQVQLLATRLKAEEDKQRFNRFETLFPDEGPLRRELYPKHLEFFAASKTHREICFMAANRVGKTVAGAYATTCHLTGLYPDWWPGRRFRRPIRAWVAGDTNETTRDVLQLELLGEITYGNNRKLVDGSGMIPAGLLGEPIWKQGVQNLVDTMHIAHASGGHSTLSFKCHPAGSRVLMADGSWSPIERVKLGGRIMGPDGTARAVTQLHAYADAPILRIETRTGEISATPNHPMFTQRGPVDAGLLVVGDVLELANADCGGEFADLWRVRMTAMMIGDGCSRGKTPFFTCNEPETVNAVRATLPDDLVVVPVNGTISYKVSSRVANHNRLKESLDADGLWGLRSVDKFIPAWVFRLHRDQRIEFLRWLWSCDGSINAKDATYVTSSHRLAQDVRLLLWSVGIHAKVATHLVGNQSGKRFRSYYIALHGANRLAFTEIGKLNRDGACSLKPRPKGAPGEIVAIHDAGRGPVYCVGVEEVHELVVDGYRVGNSYDQGRRVFQGTAKEIIWLDEESPADVYGECLMRTATTRGLVLTTFTPLLGMSEVVMGFLPKEMRPAE